VVRRLDPGDDRRGPRARAFAAGATATDPDRDFELDCEVEEVRLHGDHAVLVSRLGLKVRNKNNGETTMMRGHSLSMLERRDGRRVVVRDANTMVPVG